MAPPARSSDYSPNQQLQKSCAGTKPRSIVEYYHGDALPAALLRAAVDLTRRNMTGIAGPKWSASEVREDMCHADTRLIAVKTGPLLLGFASYRLTLEEGQKVAYLYELQLEPHARGLGLGSELVQEVERLGRKGGAGGIMLTVHTCNLAAKRFYTGRMEFEVSPISPALCAPPVIANTCDYELLQRFWDSTARRALRKRAAAARRQLYIDAMECGRLKVRLVMSKGGHGPTPLEPDASDSDATQWRDEDD